MLAKKGLKIKECLLQEAVLLLIFELVKTANNNEYEISH